MPVVVRRPTVAQKKEEPQGSFRTVWAIRAVCYRIFGRPWASAERLQATKRRSKEGRLSKRDLLEPLVVRNGLVTSLADAELCDL